MTGDTGKAVPPGWYPDPTGQTRWWDGTQWGQAAAQTPMATGQPQMGQPGGGDPMGTAMLAHVLGIVAGFVGPLIIYLMYNDKDPFVRHHAAEALNFQITLFIAYMVSALLMIVIIGILLLPVVMVGAIVFGIQGAMAAKRGEWWVYPVNIRMVSGSVKA